jgi:hypothetical protein
VSQRSSGRKLDESVQKCLGSNEKELITMPSQPMIQKNFEMDKFLLKLPESKDVDRIV